MDKNAVTAMSDAQLSSAIKAMEERAKNGIEILVLDSSENSILDIDAYEKRTITGEQALQRLGYSDYVDEQSRREGNG